MISQKRIAEILGMPHSTVANILNGMPRYKAETRERVLNTALKLGYQPNRASIAIKRGRSNLVGIVHYGSYETGQRSAAALAREVNEQGYDSLAFDIQWHDGNTGRMLKEMVQARVEGVLFSGSHPDFLGEDELAILQRADMPVVSHHGDDFLNVPLVGDDAASSFYSLTRHLRSLGHKHILMPAVSTPERCTQARRKGFSLAVRPGGTLLKHEVSDFTRLWPRLSREYKDTPIGVIVEFDLARFGNDITSAYYEFSRKLFDSVTLPDAIVCANDQAAYGVFDAADEKRIRIPADVAVTGADNERMGRLSMFRLTTIEHDVKQSTKAAVEMLVRLIRKEQSRKTLKDHSFPGRLILRQSCGRMAGLGEEREIAVPTQPLRARSRAEKSR